MAKSIAASMTLTMDDMEVIDECLHFQLRMLRARVITTWRDREYYNKVKAVMESVEWLLDQAEELENREED